MRILEIKERNKIESQMRTDIQKAKSKLINKAKEKGLWENFGQNEVSDLYGKYREYEYTESYRILHVFSDWCMNFDLIQLRGC